MLEVRAHYQELFQKLYGFQKSREPKPEASNSGADDLVILSPARPSQKQTLYSTENEADYGDKYPFFFAVLENILCAIFSIELALHLKVEGPKVYFSDGLNWLDSSLVLLSVADVWVIRTVGIKADLRMLSVLRMMRLIRLAWLLRLFRMFKELTLIVSGFVDSMRTLFWTVLFLVIVVYMFAIFAKQMIGEAQDADTGESVYFFDEAIGTQESLFGSVDKSMLTLFVCFTEGCGMDVARITISNSPGLGMFWLIFVFVTTFGLLLACGKTGLNSFRRHRATTAAVGTPAPFGRVGFRLKRRRSTVR